MYKLATITLALSLTTGAALAQPTIHEQVQQTYSFQPHTLSSAEIAKKSDVLDSFWSSVKASKDKSIPALRIELKDLSNPPFFLFDGSMLLLSLSDTHEDHVITLAAMAHCDLRDVQSRDYFLQVHRMASAGEDATAAALHILSEPKFTVIIPQHALTLGQNYALVNMLLPTKDVFWLQPAVTRLKAEKDETAQKSLLLLLWYAQRPDSDQAIAGFATENSKSAGARDYARALIKRGSQLRTKTKADSASEESIRAKRMDRMKAVSDEALEDLDALTAQLIAKRK